MNHTLKPYLSEKMIAQRTDKPLPVSQIIDPDVKQMFLPQLNSLENTIIGCICSSFNEISDALGGGVAQ